MIGNTKYEKDSAGCFLLLTITEWKLRTTNATELYKYMVDNTISVRANYMCDYYKEDGRKCCFMLI
jgi:hypothetical protein